MNNRHPENRGFDAGDFVRCLYTKDAPELEVGKVYRVVARSPVCTVRLEGLGLRRYSTLRFEHAAKEELT